MYEYTFINEYQRRSDFEKFESNDDVINLNISNLINNDITFSELLHIILTIIPTVEYNITESNDKGILRIEAALRKMMQNNNNLKMYYYWDNILNIITRWRDGECFQPAYDSDISLYTEENIKTLRYYCDKLLKDNYEILTNDSKLYIKSNVEGDFFGVDILKTV